MSSCIDQAPSSGRDGALGGGGCQQLGWGTGQRCGLRSYPSIISIPLQPYMCSVHYRHPSPPKTSVDGHLAAHTGMISARLMGSVLELTSCGNTARKTLL